MRDNRHSLMAALRHLYDADGFAYLASLLELERADFDVQFVRLRSHLHLTAFSRITHVRRDTKYATEQKVRRLRVAFGELASYFDKRNRNAFVVLDGSKHLDRAAKHLAKAGSRITAEQKLLAKAIGANRDVQDELFRVALESIGSVPKRVFDATHAALQAHMDETGEALAKMWDSDRYRRESEDPGN